MKQHRRNLILLISIFIISSLQSIASPLVTVAKVLAHIPQIIEIATKAFFSIALIAGYYVDIKPPFPSQAEDPLAFQTLVNGSTQEIFQDVSAKTGVVIKPELISELNAAGMHHDFEKLSHLLNHIESVNGIQNSNIISKIFEKNQTEVKPYALVPGIKAFEQVETYPGDVYTGNSSYSDVRENTIASFTINLSYDQKKEPHRIIRQYAEPQYKEHNGEPLVADTPQQLPSTAMSANAAQVTLETFEADTYQKNSGRETMSRFMHQGMMALTHADEAAYYEFRQAMIGVLPHLQDQNLRAQLKEYVTDYKKILDVACQKGATPEIMHAQTKIATQGLPLPGFLQDFSEALQQKVAPLWFDQQGNWHGIETTDDLANAQKASRAYDAMLSSLSIHLDYGNPAKAIQCIENLYTMDQGWGSLPTRFITWIGSFFNKKAISYQELRSRILSNSYNNQAFTALDLLQKKEFMFARFPLEDMNTSCQTNNGILLHQKLLQKYQHNIQSLYGDCKVPLIYQNDPVYWFYKPTLSQMNTDDPRIALIEGHLAIRDNIYYAIINKIYRGKSVPSLVQHLVYGMIDKLNDPMALIDHLQHLSSDSQNPEIQEACSIFFDKGILKLFDLKRQATQYGITLPDSINTSENTHLRSAANKLLLIDAQTEAGKRSLRQALSYIPYACQKDEFSKDYENIILATTQAHTHTGSSRGVISIHAIPHPRSTLQYNLNNILLKAAGKAANNNLSKADIPKEAGSPLTTGEAWSYIKEVQDMAAKGDTSYAEALAQTYLQGYIDGKMPRKYLYGAMVVSATTAAAGGGIWWATSGDQQNQRPKTHPQGPSFESPDPEDDDEKEDETNDEKIAKYKKNLDEILSKTTAGEKTSNKKLKQYEKSGGFEEAVKDFEMLNPSNLKDIPLGKMGNLPDGRRVNVRYTSSKKCPTLEILNPITRHTIKIRYNS